MVQKKGDYSLGFECALDCEGNEVGKELLEQGINLQWVFNPTPLESDVHLNKGLITELRKIKMKHSWSQKTIANCIKFLCNLDYCHDESAIKRQMDSIYQKQLKLSRADKQ